MSLNENNLYNVQSKTGQPVIIVDGVAFPVGPVYNVEESTTDLSFITATANDILQGKIGVDVNGNQIEGAIETVTVTLNNNVITVPKGYIETAQTLTVNVAQEPTVDGNVVTFFPGYVENEKSITIGNAKEAQTYTPNTADQTIAADTFLTGVQIIKGDANLLPENIKEGVSIFGVIGTYSGDNSGGDTTQFLYTSFDFSDSNANGNWKDSGERSEGMAQINGEWVTVESIVYENTSSGYKIYWSDTPLLQMKNAEGTTVYENWGIYTYDVNLTSTNNTWILAGTNTDEVVSGYFSTYSADGGGGNEDPDNESIKPEITVTTPVTLTGTQNTAITNIQLVATVSDNGTPTFTSSDLPEGLTLSNTGLISGTPTGSGSGSSTITVSYTGAESKTITLNWTIEAVGSGEEDSIYIYSVNGFGDEEVNGLYYDSGEKNVSNQTIYTNGKYGLSYDEIWWWHFHSLSSASDEHAYYYKEKSTIEDSPVGDASNGWAASAASNLTIGTVQKYSSERTHIKISGCSSMESYNGKYYVTDLTHTSIGGQVYKHETNEVYYYHSDGYWTISTNYTTSSNANGVFFNANGAGVNSTNWNYRDADGSVTSCDGMKSELVEVTPTYINYLYTAIGFPAIDANGKYYDSGKRVDLFSELGIIWTNDAGYTIKQSDVGPVSMYSPDNDIYYENWGKGGGFSYGTTPDKMGFTWTAGASNDLASGDTSKATFITYSVDGEIKYINVVGCPMPNSNGNYYPTDLTSYNEIVYKHESAEIYYYYYDMKWRIGEAYNDNGQFYNDKGMIEGSDWIETSGSSIGNMRSTIVKN